MKNLRSNSDFTKAVFSLVRALCDFHYAEKATINLLDVYKQAKILLDKKLIKEAKKLVVSAKKEASASESFLELVKFNRLHTAILKAEKTGKAYEEERTKIQTENLIALKKLLNYQEYENLAQKAHTLHRRYSQKIEESLLAQAKELLDNPLMANPEMAQSTLAKLLFYQIKNTFNLDGNRKQSIQDFKNILLLFEEKPIFLAPRIQTYLNTHLNLITSLIYDYQFEEAEKSIIAYEKIPSLHTPLFDKWELMSHRHTCVQRWLMLYSVSTEYKKALRLLPEISKLLTQATSSPVLHNDAYTYCYLIHNLTLADEWEEAEKWITQFFNIFRDKKFVIAIRSSIMMLEAIRHLHLAHHSLAHSVIQKLQRYLKDLKMYGEEERIIVNCLNRRLKIVDEEERKSLYAKTLTKLERFEKPPSFIVELFLPFLKK